MKKYLIDMKIWIYDYNVSGVWNYILLILDDKKGNQVVDGIVFYDYDGDFFVMLEIGR